ncbi:C2 calcium-dependent domain-containing protein 4A-like isoform X1 [Simochromis diagramma]|uniref:C2 calcium-dependent domain-containing protein 4A-like isoform X1 n=2 Tax=Simochromis diagramma TaxID=43689 RepID=UPI001A7E44B2|nr:C2 calcium-dependent domain-containing protein 4A-like isoform X1 [Simochromis diagramma]
MFAEISKRPPITTFWKESTMSAFKPRSLQTLVLTPEKIPSFFLLPCTPRPYPVSPERTRLLSHHGGDGERPPENPPSPASSPRFHTPLPVIHPHTAAAVSADVDMDLTTRAAMSLCHVPKVTTPYGFRNVLAVSPCTRRRESLFHRNRGDPHTVSDPADLGPGPSPSRRARTASLHPMRTLGLQVIKALQRPAATLKALSPAIQRTTPK